MRRKFGWVPNLTGNLNSEIQNIRDILKQLDYKEENDCFSKFDCMSDKRRHRILNKLGIKIHKIEIKLVNDRQYEITVKSRGKNEKTLLKGLANLLDDRGLVKYEIKVNRLDLKKTRPEDQIHRVVRDLLHKHIHHESDLPLRTVSSKDENSAKEELYNMYLEKFKDYKKAISYYLRTPLLRLDKVYKDVLRMSGEVIYAKRFCQIYALPEDYTKTIESFEETAHKFLREVTQAEENRRFWINVLLTFVMIFLSYVMARDRIPIPLTYLDYADWIFSLFILTVFLCSLYKMFRPI